MTIKKYKKQTGITLIALVITIIVLMILIGVVLVSITGRNQLIEKASEGQILTELKQINEQLQNFKIETVTTDIQQGDYSKEMNNEELMKSNIINKIEVKSPEMTIGVINLQKINFNSLLGKNINDIKDVHEIEELSQLSDVYFIDINTNDIYYIRDKIWGLEGEVEDEELRPEPNHLGVPKISVNPSNCEKTSFIEITISYVEGDSEIASTNEYQYYLSKNRTKLLGGTWKQYIPGQEFEIGDEKNGEYYLFIKRISDVKGNKSIGNTTVIKGETYHRFGKYIFDNTFEKFKIYYDLDGGIASPENPRTYTQATKTFTLNPPVKEHYVFLGWTGDNGEEPQTEVTIEEGSTGDKSFKANWRPYTYEVEYLGNGATSGSMAKTAYRYEEEKALRKNSYLNEKILTYNFNYSGATKENQNVKYTFKKWNTKQDGTGVSYTDEQKVKNLTEIDEGKVTLYAQWEKTAVTLKTPTRAGHQFVEWNTKADGTGEKYTAGQSISIDNNMELYAIWKDVNPPSATITNISQTGKRIGATITVKDNETSVNYNASKYIIDKSSSKKGVNSTEWTSSTAIALNTQTTNISNTVETTGKYYIHVKTEDMAGNKIEIISNVIWIDDEAPVIKSIIQDNTASSLSAISNLQAKAIDSESGIVAFQFTNVSNLTANSSGWIEINQTTNEIAQNYPIASNETYYFYAKDAANNVAKKAFTINNYHSRVGQYEYSYNYSCSGCQSYTNYDNCKTESYYDSCNSETYTEYDSCNSLSYTDNCNSETYECTGCKTTTQTVYCTKTQTTSASHTHNTKSGSVVWVNYPCEVCGTNVVQNGSNRGNKRRNYTITGDESYCTVSHGTYSVSLAYGGCPKCGGWKTPNSTVPATKSVTCKWKVCTGHSKRDCPGDKKTVTSCPGHKRCPGHKKCPGHTKTRCPGHIRSACPGHTSWSCPGNHTGWSWTSYNYSIIYNSNGGSGSMSSTSAYCNSRYTLRRNTYTRAGYKFLGWSTSSTATVPTYADEASIKNLKVTSGSVTLYAIWKKI